MVDYGVTRPVSRSGNIQNNAANERFFSSLKTERTDRKTCKTGMRPGPVFRYIERFYNTKYTLDIAT